MINLLTRAPTNCLPFQNQIANDDKTAGNATFVYGCRGGVVQGLNDSDLQIYRPAGIYFIVSYSRTCQKKYARLNHDVPSSGRLTHGPRS